MTVTSWGSRVCGCAWVRSCDHAGVWGDPRLRLPGPLTPVLVHSSPPFTSNLSIAAATNAFSPQCALLHAKQLWSCLTLGSRVECSPLVSSVHGDSPGRNTGVGSHALLQGFFLTQGSNPSLLSLPALSAGGFFNTSASWDAFTQVSPQFTDSVMLAEPVRLFGP